MKIDSVRALYFTGAGTTKTVALAFCRAIEAPFELVDATPRSCELRAARPGDLLVCAVPSYGGRVPAPFLERLASMGRASEPVPAVMLVTYGNRAVDDTFIELADALDAQGIVPVGGAAVVAHHSLMTNVAEGRPDAQDLAAVEQLAQRVRSALEDAPCVEDARLAQVPGARPYRAYDGVPFHPVCQADRCVQCGACAALCPVGAIDPEHPEDTDEERCISCMRCVAACHRGAREIGGGLKLAVARKAFALKCAKRCESYLL